MAQILLFGKPSLASFSWEGFFQPAHPNYKQSAKRAKRAKSDGIGKLVKFPNSITFRSFRSFSTLLMKSWPERG
jgi:hypothetical protein